MTTADGAAASALVARGVDRLRAAGLDDHVASAGVDAEGPFLLLDAEAPVEAAAVLTDLAALRVEQEAGTYVGDW